MAISFVASNEGDLPWDVFYTFNAPAGMLAGDLVILAAVRNIFDDLDWATYGWTRVGNYNFSAGRTLGVGYRWAAGGDVSWFTQTGGSTEADGVYGVCAYRGVDSVTPVANSNSSAAQSGNDIVCPALTGVAGGLAVWIGGDNNATNVVNPGGTTERIDRFNATPFSKIWMADEQISAGGSTGTRTATVGAAMSFAAASLMLNALATGQPSQVRGKYIPGVRSPMRGL